MAKQDDKTKLVLKILVVLLALLSLALLIALIVVATKDKTEPVENGSSSGVKDFCPETTELQELTTVRSSGLYDDLSKDEIIAVRDYILSQSSLNVTPYEDAAINNNYNDSNNNNNDSQVFKSSLLLHPFSLPVKHNSQQWRHRGLMVRVLDIGSGSPGSSPGWGHYVVFLGKTLHSRGVSLHPGV